MATATADNVRLRQLGAGEVYVARPGRRWRWRRWCQRRGDMSRRAKEQEART